MPVDLKAPVNLGTLARLATHVGAAIRRATNPLESRVAAVETKCGALAMMMTRGPDAQRQLRELEELIARVRELEARPTFHYEGTWESAKEYAAGSFCTHGGSLWHANATCCGVRPGDGAGWTLAAKRGRDGKDATR